jgi:hypothetical protein
MRGNELSEKSYERENKLNKEAGLEVEEERRNEI